MKPGDELPPRYLVIAFDAGDGMAHRKAVAWSHLEEVEHALEQWTAHRKDRLLTLDCISGAVVRLTASQVTFVEEQSLDTLAADFAISAIYSQLEEATKRSILGTDYDPERH